MIQETFNRIGIRADASPTLGMGHIMRCISIAQALIEIGVKSIFVCANEYPAETIRQYGFEVQIMNTSYENMEAEQPTLFEVVDKLGLSGILVDSYFATDKYLSMLQSVMPVVYIDGLYKCRAKISGVINYNAAASIEEYRKWFEEENTRILVGLEYTPLRTEFRKNTGIKVIREQVGSILLTTGATDNFNVVPALCHYWKKNRLFEDIEKHIIIGKLFKEPEMLIKELAGDKSFVFHVNTTDMKDHMENADIAISAAGTTVYELLVMRVPSVIFALADIQNKVAILSPAIKWVGDLRDTNNKGKLDDSATRIITIAVSELVDSYADRTITSKLAGKCIDGKGAERLAKGIWDAIRK